MSDPSLINFALEAPRASSEAALSVLWTLKQHFLSCSSSTLPSGDGSRVVLLPGFMAPEISLRSFGQFLKKKGYDPHGWGCGQNQGPKHIPAQKAADQAYRLYKDGGKKPMLMLGQSLGGPYACAVANKMPEIVKGIVTLGSPIATETLENPHPENAAEDVLDIKALEKRLPLPLRALFNWKSPADHPHTIELLENVVNFMDNQGRYGIPSVHLYSKHDGFIGDDMAMHFQPDGLAKNVEVKGSHCGMGFAGDVRRVVVHEFARMSSGMKTEPAKAAAIACVEPHSFPGARAEAA